MRKIGKLTYNGVSSDTLGVIVSGEGSFDAAALDYTAYQVPGRNGDVIISNNRYHNIEVTYPAFTFRDLGECQQAIRNWMRSAVTYTRIEDNYDADHFRVGIGKDVLSFSPAPENAGANLSLLFECKPQRFLKSGETEVECPVSLQNDTNQIAKPLIRVDNPAAGASVTVVSGGKVQTMTCLRAATGTVWIDSEMQNVYSATLNLNAEWEGDFPLLYPGAADVSFSGAEGAAITPRWWEL